MLMKYNEVLMMFTKTIGILWVFSFIMVPFLILFLASTSPTLLIVTESFLKLPERAGVCNSKKFPEVSKILPKLNQFKIFMWWQEKLSIWTPFWNELRDLIFKASSIVKTGLFVIKDILFIFFLSAPEIKNYIILFTSLALK